jgi:hypothetical protein
MKELEEMNSGWPIAVLGNGVEGGSDKQGPYYIVIQE